MEIHRIYVLQEYHGKKSGTVIYRSGTGNSSANSSWIYLVGEFGKRITERLDFILKWIVVFDKHVFTLGDDINRPIIKASNKKITLNKHLSSYWTAFTFNM
jgi:hypothetical protein